MLPLELLHVNLAALLTQQQSRSLQCVAATSATGFLDHDKLKAFWDSAEHEMSRSCTCQ